eukprot:g72426.t1
MQLPVPTAVSGMAVMEALHEQEHELWLQFNNCASCEPFNIYKWLICDDCFAAVLNNAYSRFRLLPSRLGCPLSHDWLKTTNNTPSLEVFSAPFHKVGWLRL